MDDNEAQEPDPTVAWQPEVEDDANSIDENLEDRDSETGASKNLEVHAAETADAPGNLRDRAAETSGAPRDLEGHASETGAISAKPQSRAAETIGVPGSSQGYTQRHSRGQGGQYTDECTSIDCSKRRIEVKKLSSKIRSLEKETRRLKDALERKNEGAGKQTIRTWPRLLRLAERNNEHNSGDKAKRYADIYKLSCLEENANARTIHPALTFMKPTPRIVDRDACKCAQQRRRKAEIASVLKDLVLNPSKPKLFLEHRMKYSFHDLPGSAQHRIIYLLFSYPGKLIHAISRLDPYVEPADIPPVDGKRSGLLNRFHITGKHNGRSCSLTYTVKGDEMLAPLLVSRKFLFLGAHAFYGCNTFAFSSLGKFGRFTQGIGPARRQRLQHIELLWIGSQTVTQECHSRRTWSLASLCEMSRLKSLTLYFNETYVRRNHEGIVQMAYLAGKTSGQPDFRLTRNLRTVQGMDYVRQLRGLRALRILDHKECQPVRDWTFVLDLETTCKREKPFYQHEKSKLQNLLPLPEGFAPSTWEWEAAKSHYDLIWFPERILENGFPDAAEPAVLAANDMDSQPVNPGGRVAGPDLSQNGADTAFAHPIDWASNVNAAPACRPALRDVPPSTIAADSRTMDIDEIDRTFGPGAEDSLVQAHPSQELNPFANPDGNQGSELGFGLFVEDPTAQPLPDPHPDPNTDEDTYPLLPLTQNVQPEARVQSVRSENTMFMGPEPDISEGKSLEGEKVDGQESLGTQSSVGAFEWWPSCGVKHPPMSIPQDGRPSTEDGDTHASDRDEVSDEGHIAKVPQTNDIQRGNQGGIRDETDWERDGEKSEKQADENSDSQSSNSDGEFGVDGKIEVEEGNKDDASDDNPDGVRDGSASNLENEGEDDSGWDLDEAEFVGFSSPPGEDTPGTTAVAAGQDRQSRGSDPDNMPGPTHVERAGEDESESEGTVASQAEQNDSPELDHARKGPSASGAKKRPGENLSPSRKKKPRRE